MHCRRPRISLYITPTDPSSPINPHAQLAMASPVAADGPATTAAEKKPPAPVPRLFFASSSASDDASDSSSPLPSFAEFVVKSCGCTKEQGEAYDKALALAETNLFGRLDREEVEAAAAVDASDASPTHCLPPPTSLSACHSSASSVKDDEDPKRPKPPLIEHLDDLAAEYFGRNWDRVEELVQINQECLEAWKAARAVQKHEQQQEEKEQQQQQQEEEGEEAETIMIGFWWTLHLVVAAVLLCGRRGRAMTLLFSSLCLYLV